ncbi:MAG: hypothetical protein ABH834_03990 [Candidatus Altiarchaeota archaeon]
MTEKLVVTVELKGEKDKGVLSVDWEKENLTYFEMLGFLEVAKDRIKEKTESGGR